jgi:dephospho-CoA kinase
MITVGITGGIGSGKSTVSKLLTTLDVPVYEADKESKRLIDSSLQIRKQLVKLLGENIYTQNGVNRQLMAAIIFNDSELLEKVNGILHPAVAADFQDWTKKQQADLVALEAAILFESGFDRLVDYTVMVYAPRELRIQRTVARDKVTEAEVIQRMNCQFPDEALKQKVNFVIVNDGLQPLIPQVESLIAQLRPV